MTLTHTQMRLLDIVRRHDGLTRSDLTGLAGIAQQNVYLTVQTLEERGYVHLRKGSASGRGKPSPRVELIADAHLTLGMSVNSDAIELCVVDLACANRWQQKFQPVTQDVTSIIATLHEMAQDALSDLDLPRGRVGAAGFSISGFKSDTSGRFVTPPPLSHWSDRSIHADLLNAFGMPVWLENNATAGAIGEAMIGAGLDHDSFAYLSFNYGFGGGLIYAGEPIAGSFGNAGELSRMFSPVQTAHRPALGELIKRLNAHGIAIETVSDLVAQYDPNWPAVERWIAEVKPQLDQALRALEAVFDPSAIVFGGEAPFDLRARLISASTPQAFDRFGRPMPGPTLLNSAAQTDPAAFGAGLMAQRNTALSR